ncbi:MAG TPA: prolyl oligopeptidase family serine peptidase [Thermoanaerobaculia bacterium]|nr:prolyl oligopeptidase family serine peptidase [Thermoanaerobaculia bacterium]
MRFRSTVLAFVALTAISAFAQLPYPQTRKVDQKDTYPGGVVVADPYRWLETDVRESDEVRSWVDAENKVTFGYLESLPSRNAIKNRLTSLWNYEKYTIPTKRGGHYYFRKNDGLQNQSVLYVQKSLSDPPHVLIDPNTWSKDGTIALTQIHPSDDGRYLAYGVAEAGSDWVVWHVLEVDSGKPLADELRWIKFSQASWTNDSKGFFYSRYPKPEGAALQSLNKNQKIYYHRVGTPQTSDVLVYERPEQPDWNFGGDVTEDGRYLVITISKGTGAKYQILVRDLNDPYAAPVTLIGTFDNEYAFFGNDGPLFYFRTDLDAPRRRVIGIDITKPERANWKEVLPQGPDLLADINYVGGKLVAEYLKDAHSEVKVFSTDGKLERSVDLGPIGTTGGFNGRQNDPETFYSFESFTVPPSIYRYDVSTGEKKLLYQSKVQFDPSQFEVKQVFYTSKDGTRVPMFVASRKGIRLDGNNPTLLYAYGGFNISTVPRFSVAHLVWMQMGGVYASANLRGGSEYGEEWHKAGTKLQKQNVFDDFISAAEWLIKNKYTRPQKLAVNGASNGGLLVGAVLTQRPDLFGATLPQVGVMDMLRFQRFTAGRFWVDDYGSSDNADEFKALYAYSPYHNLKKGTKYPATLVTTADHDDRVVPGHSFKFAAKLQEDQAGPAPVLIRIETRAGHGAGKPITKQIEETADQYAFLVANLGMKPRL